MRQLLEHRLYEYFEYTYDPELKGQPVQRIDECIDQIMDDIKRESDEEFRGRFIEKFGTD